MTVVTRARPRFRNVQSCAALSGVTLTASTLVGVANPAAVTEIHIANCQVARLAANAFAAFSRVTWLELSTNSITWVEDGAFNGLTLLTIL